jgi:rubrerythrin
MAKKINRPTEKEYREEAIKQAFQFAPRIYACKKCGWPVADGFCCEYCGDINPSSID